MRAQHMRSLFNYDGIKVDCIYCEKVNTDYTGWEGLCNRMCYYGISELLEKYNTGQVTDPDPKIVKYFTKYPEPNHSFVTEKILSFIKQRAH